MISAMASFLLFDDSCRHIVHQSLLFSADVINSCLFGVLFPILSVASLPFFADAGHQAPQMLENYGGIK